MSDTENANIVNAAFAKAEEYIVPDIITIKEPGTGVEALVTVNAHGTVVAVDEDVFNEFRAHPKVREDKAVLTDLASFIAYTNRFASADTALFANDSRSIPSLTAVLDFHPEGPNGAVDPAWGNHRAVFRFPLSDEWNTWTGLSGERMTMLDFAAFLENNIVNVMPIEAITVSKDDEETQRFLEAMGGKAAFADPAKLLEIANNLTINEASHVKSANNLSSGEGTIEFSNEYETSTATGKIVMPKMFAIGVPVFKNGVAYQVLARLRFRKNGGQISFWFDLYRTDRMFDHAFAEAVEKAAKDTNAPVFLGVDRS